VLIVNSFSQLTLHSFLLGFNQNDTIFTAHKTILDSQTRQSYQLYGCKKYELMIAPIR